MKDLNYEGILYFIEYKDINGNTIKKETYNNEDDFILTLQKNKNCRMKAYKTTFFADWERKGL